MNSVAVKILVGSLICAVVAGVVLVGTIFGFWKFDEKESDKSVQVDEGELGYADLGRVVGEIDFAKMVEEGDPKAAMARLAEELKKNPALENVCHGITHDIGHAAFEKYGFNDALMDFEDDICGSGYMHGVTEEYLSTADDPLAAMLTACPAGYGACFHGVGHGLLLYYENDIPKATAGCDMFEEVSEQVSCSEGIFMQNFSPDVQGSENENLDPTAPLSPCDEQSDLHKSACYFYAPRYFLNLHEREYEEAVEICLGAEEEYVGRCIRGIGSVTMKQNIGDLAFVEAVCLGVPEEHQNECYGGLTGYYVIHSGSVKEAEKLCPMLNKKFQTMCRGTVKGSAGFFGE